MGKTGKWLRIFLTGKKDRDKGKERCTSHDNLSIVTENPTTPIPSLPTPTREKRRWSFRRSSATAPAAKDSNAAETTSARQLAVQAILESENEQKKHALAVAAATAAAADAAVAAAQAAVAMIRLTTSTTGRGSAIEEASAIKIQSVFRSHLARKALCALKGLVKLQALVRGHLVRKQATATLRCMQALVTAQARALAQRIQMAEEIKPVNETPSIPQKSTQDNRYRHTYNAMDRGMEENIKIVEMDHGELKGSSTKSRSSISNHPQPEVEHRLSFNQSAGSRAYSKQDEYQVSPAPSALTDMSPKACSGHFEDYAYSTAQSSPHYYSAMSKPDPTKLPFLFPRPDYAESMSYEYPYFPNYMANTESSRAKVRSQSAPKQRPELYEKQPSRRRVSMEGRNIPRAVRMQRSSSHVGTTAQNYHYPWSIKLDRSMVSVIDSECGSTSTVLTNNNYCRSLVAFDVSTK